MNDVWKIFPAEVAILLMLLMLVYLDSKNKYALGMSYHRMRIKSAIMIGIVIISMIVTLCMAFM